MLFQNPIWSHIKGNPFRLMSWSLGDSGLNPGGGQKRTQTYALFTFVFCSGFWNCCNFFLNRMYFENQTTSSMTRQERWSPGHRGQASRACPHGQGLEQQFVEDPVGWGTIALVMTFESTVESVVRDTCCLDIFKHSFAVVGYEIIFLLGHFLLDMFSCLSSLWYG